MSFLNRRGVIGFVLTMAVGAALGAAALVVGNEIKKEKAGKKQPAIVSPNKLYSSSKVQESFTAYQNAYSNYQKAVAEGRSDTEEYAEKLQSAKKALEIHMLANTPTDIEGNIPGIVDIGSEGSIQTPILGDSKNPFSGGSVNIGNSSNNAVTQEYESLNANSESVVTATTDSYASSVDSSQAQIASSMDYYKVKSGDSLSKICEKFYGNSGMWEHILKYQVPSIAATPNLIYPGQMIVLPRGITEAIAKEQSLKDKIKDKASELKGKIKDKYNDVKDKISDKLSSSSHGVAPVGDESWQDNFQKDYLVSDHTLTDSNSYSVSQIQSFLEYKGSVLAKPYRGSSPAKMIYNAAKKYGISPKVLLTRLQCEQGLISKKTATQKELDWAVGVGCYDSGNWNQKYKGFDKQIEYAAATYRRHYDVAQKALKSGKSLNMTIDNQSIHVKNAASYAFYKYCPHFAGNKLFIDVWNGYKKRW